MAEPTELREIVVEREDVEVLFARAASFPDGFADAWANLENVIGSLRGRKFYGAFHPQTADYWVCVELRPDDDVDALPLERTTLSGGRYLRARLEGEPPPLYERIAPAFAALDAHADTDPARPRLEFYRRHDAVDLLVPLA
jgi:hypothetical protein